MPTTEWHIPFELQTSLGTLLFNQGAYPRFNMDQQRCRARRDIRATVDPIPQGDGEIFHERFTGGYEMTINCQPWLSEDQFACPGLEVGGVSVATMRDTLYAHLWRLLRPDEAIQHRVVWEPTGLPNRMLDMIRLLSIADPTITREGLVTFEFVVDTMFPYAISETQTVETINGVGQITNAGNVDFWPVIRLNDDGGDIYNATTDKTISIGGGCLGGGSYIEIDTFRMTAYVDGDQANAKPCVDVELTDFFPIVPGVNDIFTTASCDFLMNDAWA